MARINVYKTKRGWYKIVYISPRHGVETFLLKGKDAMRKKVELLQGLAFL